MAKHRMISKRNSIILLLILQIIGCTPVYIVNRSFIPLDSKKMYAEKSQNVELYFVGEQPKFEYEKLGVVEVKASNNVDKSHLFSHLKYEAWNQGADAVISVSKDEKYNVYSSYSGSGRSRTVNVINYPYIQGVAVKKKLNLEAQIQENYFNVDTSFLAVVRSDKKIQDKSIKTAKKEWSVYWVFILLLLISPFIIVFGILKPS